MKMKKNEFLNLLKDSISNLPYSEVEKIISFYTEAIEDRMEDGLNEEKAVEGLGSLDDIIKSIRNDSTDFKNNESNNKYENEKGKVFSKFDRKINKYTNKNQNIIVEDRNIPVYIEKSQDDFIHFEYFENENESYEITDNGTIRFTKLTKYKWYEIIFNFNIQSVYLKIFIPDSYSGYLDVRTRNGKITLFDISAKEMRLVSSNGSVNIEKCNVANDLIASTSNASINIEGVNVVGRGNLKTSNGKIDVFSINAVELIAQTSNSSINVEKLEIMNTLTLVTSNGKIRFQEINVKSDIRMETSNSSIIGKINSSIKEYKIRSTTSNGSNNLPQSLDLGIKKLDISTSNGSINVEFLKD
jgi:hypothetical protein